MTAPSQLPESTSLRVAWFSPLPPSRSGIAAYSHELLPLLRGRGWDIDVYAEPLPGSLPAGPTARDFVWTARRRPYALTVYQLGNAACHDYMWGYLFRYPGLVVLHDAQVHQARAQGLLKRYRPRRDDYLEEFAANHPDAPPDLALLVAEGLGGSLFAHWPLIRLGAAGAPGLRPFTAPALAAAAARRLRGGGGRGADGRGRSAGPPSAQPPRQNPRRRYAPARGRADRRRLSAG